MQLNHVIALLFITYGQCSTEDPHLHGRLLARTPSLADPFPSDRSLALAATIVNNNDAAVFAALGVIVSRRGVPPTVALLALGSPPGPRAAERLAALAPDVALHTIVEKEVKTDDDNIGDDDADDDVAAEMVQAQRVVEHMSSSGAKKSNRKCVLWLHSALDPAAARDAAVAAVSATTASSVYPKKIPLDTAAADSDESGGKEEEENLCGGAGFGGGVFPLSFFSANASSSSSSLPSSSSTAHPPLLLTHEKEIVLAPQGAHWRCNGALLIDHSGGGIGDGDGSSSSSVSDGDQGRNTEEEGGRRFVRYKFALPWRVCETPCSQQQVQKKKTKTITQKKRSCGEEASAVENHATRRKARIRSGLARLGVDVVIPAHPKDALTLRASVAAAWRHVHLVRRVLVVSKQRLLPDPRPVVASSVTAAAAAAVSTSTSSSSADDDNDIDEKELSDIRMCCGAEWVPEANFPFSLEDVARVLPESWTRNSNATTTTTTTTEAMTQNGVRSSSAGSGTAVALVPNEQRVGWYLQQLLKLYAHEAIQDLSEYYLVLDADVILLRDTSFFVIAPTGTTAALKTAAQTTQTARTVVVPMMTAATENNRPFFAHATELFRQRQRRLQRLKRGGGGGGGGEGGDGPTSKDPNDDENVNDQVANDDNDANGDNTDDDSDSNDNDDNDNDAEFLFERLHPMMSGVAHHMPLVKSQVRALISSFQEEQVPSSTGAVPLFWRMFLEAAVATTSWYNDPVGHEAHVLRSGEYPGASEYEILFNWLLSPSSSSSTTSSYTAFTSSTSTSNKNNNSDKDNDNDSSDEPVLNSSMKSAAAVRQLDWCNAASWFGSGETLVRALAAHIIDDEHDEDSGDVASTDCSSELPQQEDPDNSDATKSSKEVGADGRKQQQHQQEKATADAAGEDEGLLLAYDAGLIAAAIDSRFAPFDFVALHHHQRGEASGCDAQYCGCCGV